MADPQKPSDRTAPAAQDDVLGEATTNSGTMDGLSDEVGSDGTPRGQGGQPRAERGAADGEARSGKDENQAGFVKDPDKPFSP